MTDPRYQHMPSIAKLHHELIAVGSTGHDYAIFGSTAIRLRGIIHRPVGDVDVFVTKVIWGKLLARNGWRVETPRAGDPPILTYDLGLDAPIHVFFDWRDDAVDIDPARLISESERVGDTRVATVREVLRQKYAAYACIEEHPSVAKHRPDILACEDWLSAQAAS